MAVAYTVDYGDNSGPICTRKGTFTSAAGDGAAETFSSHGLAYITEAQISFDSAALNSPTPKITILGGTITWTVDDTLGLSGRWLVKGRG